MTWARFFPPTAACLLQDIPKILPLILNCVRMIWSLSRFYNTPERLVGLLRKLSNEIINRCCAVISLSDIFSGEVDSVIIALEQVWHVHEKCILQMTAALAQRQSYQCDTSLLDKRQNLPIPVPLLVELVDVICHCCLQSIAAGQDWKAAYEHTAKAIAARSSNPWNFNVSSVFNFVDAFKERCRQVQP